MKSLSFELPVGLSLNGERHTTVELMQSNGVAERVFVKKIAEKPFTWQGNVVAIATKSIGTVEIGAKVREQYLKDGSVTLPHAVKQMTLADISTMLVEVHRRVWENFIPKQEVICKYCAKRLLVDINLDKIVLDEEAQAKSETIKETDYDKIVVNLDNGFEFVPLKKLEENNAEYKGYEGVVFNRFIFRPPLLEDAIKNEAYFEDGIQFWRRLALECLESVQCIGKDGETITSELPSQYKTFYGLKLFNDYLGAKDLKKIRTELQEALPTLPFAYYEPCGCDRNMEIPMIMETSSFFSE